MIEHRCSMAGIGNPTASPQINPITPKMDASFIHRIFNTSFGVVKDAYNEFNYNVVISGNNIILTIDSGMIICYGYRCVNSELLQFNLQLTPTTMYYHIVFKVDLTGDTAKFTIYCTDAVSTSTLNNLNKDNLSTNDGIFEMLYGTLAVTSTTASFSITNAWFNIDSVNESKYVNGIYFENLQKRIEISNYGSMPIEIIEKKRLLFDPSIHQSKVYNLLGYGILGKNWSSSFIDAFTGDDVKYLNLNESLNVGDTIEIHFNEEIKRYRLSKSFYANTKDFPECKIYLSGYNESYPYISGVIARLYCQSNKLYIATDSTTADWNINNMASGGTTQLVVHNESSDSVSLNIKAIYKVLGE